ncbi:MAG: helix-turn-helix domain-containing protein [Lachnospiraceae bacterium]|nr:helix-turn-helix domain-containing protein [Lachnospiraceae bacterium]
MIRAYSELYLNDARKRLANSFDYAVYTLGYPLEDYHQMFIKSGYAGRFGRGNARVISGVSGIELTLRVIEACTGKYDPRERVYNNGKSPEYWVGWALGFYQWYSACSFETLQKEVPISSMLLMYDKYHEMDIMHFVDRVNQIRQQNRAYTYLRMFREKSGLSQSELAKLTDIPVRTIQQYEQRQKSINHARAEYVIALAKALNVQPVELMEIENPT